MSTSIRCITPTPAIAKFFATSVPNPPTPTMRTVESFNAF